MIRFSKFIWLYVLISALVLVPGIFSLIRFGFKSAIDFTGGTLVEMRFAKNYSKESLETVAAAHSLEGLNIQSSDANTYLLRMKSESSDALPAFFNDVAKNASNSFEILRNESVGPVLGKELMQKTFVAALLAIVAILSYVAYAFKNIKYGVSAILALIHDLLVVCGAFSLLGHVRGVEIDTLFVTAVLTTMSFSVHDTIVVFDRIRELSHKGDKLTFEQRTDVALTETMGRSLANSFTIIFMLLALVLMGGATTLWFSFALLIGTVSGTYSSPFVATPILILWNRFEKKKTLKR